MDPSTNCCLICLEKLNGQFPSSSSSTTSDFSSRREICGQFHTTVSRFIQMNKKLDIDVSQLYTLIFNKEYEESLSNNEELHMCCENCFESLDKFCKNYEQIQSLHKELLQTLYGISLKKKTASQKVHVDAADDDDVNTAVNDFHFGDDDDDQDHDHDEDNIDVKPQTADVNSRNEITVLKVLERPASEKQAEVTMKDNANATVAHPRLPTRGRHVGHSMGAAAYQCQVCQKKFKYKGSLTSHQVTLHTVSSDPEAGKKTCKLCQAKFDTRINLNRHLLKYHKEKKLVCEEPNCGKRFIKHINLVSHQKLHQNGSAFECDLCSKKFTHQKNLLSHTRAAHGKPKSMKRPQCDICLHTFENTMNLTRHLINDHNVEKKFVCEEPNCGRKFFRRSNLLRHRPIHLNPPDDPKPHLCHLCPSKFALREDLSDHQRRVHCDKSLARKHLCDLCGKRFARPGELLSHHRLKHNPERPEIVKVKVSHKCDFEGCGKIFNKKILLREHALTHTTEKTPCDHCGESFKRVRNLRKHILLSHPEVPAYQCKECGERFYTFVEMQPHREKFHPSKSQMLGKGKWRVRK